jgi:hypothetical protein
VTTLARWVSILAHPFVMVALMVLGAALRFGTPAEAVRTLGVVILLTLVPVAVLMLRQVRRGAWANVDASGRAERPVLFLVGTAGLAVLLVYSLVFRPQSFLLRGGTVTLAMVAACAVATRWLKVSLHMAFGTLATTTLVLLGSAIGWALVPAMPLLAWSRLRLGRHDRGEVVAGALAGVVSGFLMNAP